MAGYVPGQQPANRSQEKEFVQAYEDVLERYKGTAGATAGAGDSAGAGARGPARRGLPPGPLQVGRPGGVAPSRRRRWPRSCCFSGPVYVQS